MHRLFIYLYTCYIIQNVQLLILASRHNVGSFLVAVIVCHLFTSRSEQLTNLVVVDRNLKKQNTPKLNYQTTANRLITGVRLWSSRWVTWGNPESQQGGSPSGSPGCLFVSEFVSRFKGPSAAAAQSRSRQSPRLAIKNIKSKLGGSDGCRQCSNSQVCMTHFPPWQITYALSLSASPWHITSCEGGTRSHQVHHGTLSWGLAYFIDTITYASALDADRCKGNRPVRSRRDLIWFDNFIWTRKSHWQQSFLKQEISCAQDTFSISITWNREKTKRTRNTESVEAIKTQRKFSRQISCARG